MTFVPFALVFGVVTERTGIDRARQLFVGLGGAAVLLMMVVLPKAPPIPEVAAPLASPPAPEPAFPPDPFLPPDDPVAPGHQAVPSVAWSELGMRLEGAETMEVARAAIAEMPPTCVR